MDVLSEVLRAVRVTHGIFVRFSLGDRWALSVPAQETSAFHIVVSGPCWLHLEGESAPRSLSPGDVFLVPHGLAHWMGARPGLPATPLAQVLENHRPEAGPLYRAGTGSPITDLVCGSFSFELGRHHPLRVVLPPLLHLSPRREQTEPWLDGALALMAREAALPRLGGQVVSARLTEVFLVQVLRAWLEQLPEGEGGWLGALRDPRIGAALAAIHREPAAGWTVVSLAREARMSRSAFAAQFARLVGESPAQYVARWRLQLAAKMLSRGRVSVGAVASQVGYQSETSFSKAFRRLFGAPPSRARGQAAE